MELSGRAIGWLEARGLDPELAVKLGLGSSSGAGGEEIVVPYLIGADVVNHKYRTLDDKRHRQDRDAVKCLWNYNAITDPSLADQPLVITEGEWDAIAAMQCGIARVVSVPDGAPAHEIGADPESRKYDYLEHAKAALRDVKEIILATDSDSPGQALMNDLAIRLGKARCKWIPYPKGCKDLNETLLAHGPRGIEAVFKRAQSIRVDGLYRMSELPPYPVRERFTTGMEWLDKHYRVRMGDFAVLTGVPGHGKSTFVNDVLCRMVTLHKWRVAIASFEQHPQADHRRALREWFCKMPEHLASDDEIARADAWIDEHFIFIVPGDDDLPNLEWCLDKCAAAVIRYGVRIVVIDPWNELDHSRPREMNLTEYTGLAIKEIKLLARRCDCHVMVVAHPVKMTGHERPSLYSISNSAHWANKCDVGIIVHKPHIDGEIAEIQISKSRYHDQIGWPGTVRARYNRVTRHFEHAPEEAAA